MTNFPNNNFFGYEGCIDRKNYTINMLIIVILCACLQFVDFSFYFKFTNLSFLYAIFEFVISLFKFILMFCAMSVVYRRLADITINSSTKTKDIAKKIFAIVYVAPLLIYFLSGIIFQEGVIIQLINLLVVFVLMPITVITTIVLAFIKKIK